jgi:hypothetical protein
MLEKS